MELHEATNTIRVSKQLCHEFEEKAVDVDILLPDYCPAVSAILKCMMRPVVTARFQSGDRYSVDGMTVIRILYMSEDRAAVHCHEMSQPFSVSFRSTGAVHHFVDIKTDYVNCRATGPRRFDIHGAFRVYLNAMGVGEVTAFADPETRDVFCQTRSVPCTIPLCEAEKSFMLDETIDLGASADRLLYGDMILHSCDYKALNNKMIVKGTVEVKAVYAKDEQTVTSSHEIPFSQIVDVEGLHDGWLCRVAVTVGESECYLQSNERGGSVLGVRAKLMACVFCSQNETVDVVLDAYSADYPLVCETMPLQVVAQGETQTVRSTVQQVTSIPEGVTQLLDIWGELKSYERKDADAMNCCILVGMIACDASGQPGYYERTIDCEITGDNTSGDAMARLIQLNGTLADGGLRVRAEMEIGGCSSERHDLTVVSKVVRDHQQPYTKCPAAIRIVYAAAGETLWEIAKQHHASVSDILAENDLTEEEIAVPTMLMIPML